MDTDILVLNSIKDLALDSGGYECAVKPVAIKNVGINWNDDLDTYWTELFEICRARPSTFQVTTTVDNIPIHSYFNSGVVAVNPRSQIFRNWAINTIAPRKRMDFVNSMDPLHSFHRNQPLFAASLTSRVPKERITLLEPQFNYPIHLQHNFLTEHKIERIDDIHILHYHNLGSSGK